MPYTYYCPKCLEAEYSATLFPDYKCPFCGGATIPNLEKEVLRHIIEEFKPLVNEFNKPNKEETKK